MKKMNVLVTGATGFIGDSLVELLLKNHNVTLLLRRSSRFHGDVREVVIPDFFAVDDWDECFANVDVVIHLAGLAHQSDEYSEAVFNEYERVNTNLTRDLAKAASAFGVKRFIYISTIKVNGEFSLPGQPFSDGDQPKPVGPYAISKYNAEQQLRDICDASGLQYVIIRPSLVYGRNVKANFRALMNLAKLPVPLPFSGLKARRDMISLDNLVDFIACCTSKDAALGNIFLVSDGRSYSVAELIGAIRSSLNRSNNLFYFPGFLIKGLLFLLGRKAQAAALFNDMEIDQSSVEVKLNWQAPYTLDEVIGDMLKGER